MRLSNPRHLAIGLLVGALSGLPCAATADDTEIYLGSETLSAGVRPNVLFILDTSGSMASTVTGTGKNRLENMQDSMIALLDQLSNVNVGLMRFTDPGGPILFPVAFIDDNADAVTSAGQADVSVRIIDGNDDVEELAGVMSLDSLQLELMETASFGPEGSLTLQVASGDSDAEQSPSFMNNSSNQMELTDNTAGNRTNGLRFVNVTVPNGATVLHAELDFRSRSNRSGTTNLTVVGHDVDNSPSFPNGPGTNDVFSRLGALTTASVAWSNVPEWFSGERYSSPELASVAQEIVDRAGWASGNAMTFIVSGTSGSLRDSSTYEDAPSNAAILRLDYSSGAGGTQKVGFRFQDVRVPQGVTINTAALEFTASGIDSSTAQIRIRAQAIDDAPAFSAAASNLSGRTLTTAYSDWTPAAWTTIDGVQQTVDLAPVIQEVINRSGWCGGNSLVLALEVIGTSDGPRRAHSFDGDPNKAPTLRIDYDQGSPLAAGQGCIVREVQSQISASKDDAEQLGSTLTLTSTTLELVDKSGGPQTVGLRFQDVQLPPGSQIIDATITFTARYSDSGATSLVIKGHDTADAAQFSSGTGSDVTSRPTTAAAVTWSSIPAWSAGEDYTTPNLSAVVDEIANGGGGWQSGNDMAFIVSGSGLRRARSFNYTPSSAAILRISYRGYLGDETAGSLTTVRERLKELVTDLSPEGYTPIVDTLYEAARYYRSDSVNYGGNRGTGSTANKKSTRVSHPASYTGGTVNRAVGCTDANLSADACITENIGSAPVYVSPIHESCQANYIVLLTDGDANHNHSAAAVSTMTGKSPCDSTFSNGDAIGSGETCGVDLAEYLKTTDQKTDVAGDNTVTTYTIGFNFSGQFIKDVAARGGGDFYTANTASELTDVFKSIFADILSQTTSFATPSLSVNAFNKLFHRNEVFFSLFKPSDTVRWSGNVKKYQLCDDETTGCQLGEVLDSREPPDGPIAAIGSDQRIKEEAWSFWSDSVDGAEILVGGAGAEVPAASIRRVFTYTGATAPTYATLETAAHTVTDANTAITVEMLGGSTDVASPLYMSPAERTALIDWMRGQDVDDEDTDGDTTDQRYSLTDPLHSSPVAVTFGGTDADPVIKLFVGTNDGGLRMINGHNGVEEWVFYPQEMLDEQRTLRANGGGDHIYGIDGTPTAWVNDENRDGIINPNIDVDGDGTYEFVRIIIGMRRGGESIYALDVTPSTATGALVDPDSVDDVSPTLMWRLSSGGSYPRLGQTWSRPRLATLRFGTVIPGESYAKTVMLVAGGYDEAQDTSFGSGGQGNAVYIIDPIDGSRLFYFSSDGLPAHGFGQGLTVPGMTFPIPSDVALMDSDGDGGADRLYVGDLGGQLWRMDLNADLTSSAGLRPVVGKLAAVSAAGSVVDERKFFYPPDVVQVRSNTYSTTSDYDLVTIASGNRANPLNQVVKDRFFAFRDYSTSAMIDGDPLDTADDDGLADGYTTLQGKIEGFSPTVPSDAGDLFDVTDKNDPQGDDLTALREASGYFLDFEASGEKGLAPPIILAGKVFFTSYLPDGVVSGSTCAIAEGAGALYGLNVLNGAAVFDWDGSGDPDLTETDRIYKLGGGIPSSAVPIFQEQGITLLIGGGGGATTVDPLIELPRVRTFWHDDAP